MFEYLFALSSSRFIYFGLIALIYVLFPRFAVWKIASQRITAMNIHWNLAVSMEMDVVIEVWNPNFVGAHIDKANLMVFRVPSIHVPCEDARENDYYNDLKEQGSSINIGLNASSTSFTASFGGGSSLSNSRKKTDWQNIFYRIMDFQTQDTCIQYPNSIEDIYAYYQSKQSSTSFEHFHDQVLYRYHHNHRKRNNHLSRFWTRDTMGKNSRKEKKQRKQKLKNMKHESYQKRQNGYHKENIPKKQSERKGPIPSSSILSFQSLPVLETTADNGYQCKSPYKNKSFASTQEYHSDTSLSILNHKCDYVMKTKGLLFGKQKTTEKQNDIRTDRRMQNFDSSVRKVKIERILDQENAYRMEDTSKQKREDENVEKKSKVASILVTQPVDFPKRSHFFIKSRVFMDHLPFLDVLSLLYEILMNKGILRAEISGLAYIKAVGINLELIMDCLQVVDLTTFPSTLVHSDCSYRFSNEVLDSLYEHTDKLKPILVDFIDSFDVSDINDLPLD